MAKQLFINMPVRDLAKSTEFYTAIGAAKNPQFSDDATSVHVISETIFVMLMTHQKWAGFTKKPAADAHRTSEVMLAISCDDRQTVDTMANTAAPAGGKADVNPVQDYGFMYNRSFEDPDGHIWEAVFMDMSQAPQG